MSEMLETAVAGLRAARRRRGLSQAQVAERIGTTQSAVARLEAEQSDPRLSTVQRYAEAVGAKIEINSPGHPAPSLARTAGDVRSALARNDADEALRHVIQFLDDLRRLSANLKRQAVREEPQPVDDKRWDALLAGIAELASHQFGFDAPGWAAAPSRFLDRFWFVIEDIIGRPAPGLATRAFVNSPPQLAARGVFLHRESLISV